MAGKTITVKKGAKTKVEKGVTFECPECGTVLKIDQKGSCDFVDCVVCCDKPMKKK